MSQLVLLVDDDVKVLRLLEATLRLKEFDVVKCERATEALDWLKTGRPDLVISDTDVPDLDGFDFFRRVRSMRPHADVPFIFLSAEGEPDEVARGLRAGADEYLRKPFAIDELLVRVIRVLERRSGPEPSEAQVFSGELVDMSVPDLLRMLSVQRRRGLLRVEPRGIDAAGLVQVDDGRVTHAEFGLLTGVSALFALLAHLRGRFSFDATARLSGDTIRGKTLPLLMEGLGLVDSGQLPRIDPRAPEEVAAFEGLVAERRRPALDESQGDASPLRLEDGRRPGSFAGLDSVDSVEFHETQRLAPLLDELESPTVVDESMGDEDEVGLSTSDFAPAFLTGELEAIEEEVSGRREWEQPTERFVAPHQADAPDAAELTGQILIVADADEDEDEDEYAVALIDDTIADVDVNTLMSPQTPRTGPAVDVMGFYETVKGAAQEHLGAASIQLGTRTGRVIASSIPEVTRRDTVAAFSSQAIMFAAEAPDGTSFASLDAGDLHVVVLEIDHLRVLTLLFERKPDPAACIQALGPHLEEYRAAR